MTELPRPVSVDRLPHAFVVEATAAECAALALRLRIPAVLALSCRFTLRRQGDVIEAEGTLDAEVVQDCVVSLEPVTQRVADRFTVRFVPAGLETDDIDPESPDELPYEGGLLDLGEAAAEQLALSLDPYPRCPGASLDPLASELDDGPFAQLAPIRRKL